MFLMLDIGGTKIRIGVAEGSEIKDSIILEESQNFEEAMDKIRTALPSLVKDGKIDAVAVGVPGVLNKQRAALFKAPNLPRWDEQPLKERLQEIAGAPVFLENDASLNGLGEGVFGAGKGFNIVGFLTVSTGLGGARIVGGKIDETAWGFEPGKQIISKVEHKALDTKQEGQFVILEDLISGNALKERYGRSAEEIEDEEVWEEVAELLAVGLNNACIFWSPDVIVLGGSVAKSIPLDKVKEKLEDFLTIFPEQPEIKLTELGDLSGLYGGLALLRQKSA